MNAIEEGCLKAEPAATKFPANGPTDLSAKISIDKRGVIANRKNTQPIRVPEPGSPTYEDWIHCGRLSDISGDCKPSHSAQLHEFDFASKKGCEEDPVAMDGQRWRPGYSEPSACTDPYNRGASSNCTQATITKDLESSSKSNDKGAPNQCTWTQAEIANLKSPKNRAMARRIPQVKRRIKKMRRPVERSKRHKTSMDETTTAKTRPKESILNSIPIAKDTSRPPPMTPPRQGHGVLQTPHAPRKRQGNEKMATDIETFMPELHCFNNFANI